MKIARSSTALLAAVAATSMGGVAVAGASSAVAEPGMPVHTVAPADGAQPAKIVVGPGSPIRMPYPDTPMQDGRHIQVPSCSLGVPGTVVGKDGVEREVFLTAGHCLDVDRVMDVGPHATGDVFVPTKDGDVLLGKGDVVNMGAVGDDEFANGGLYFLNSVFNQADYAFVAREAGIEVTSLSQSVDEFGEVHGEPVQMVGIVDRETLEPMGIAVDNFGEPICTDGTRTGRNCGVQLFRARHGVWAIGLGIDHGDSGGNAYNPESREVIGVTSMGIGPISRYEAADVAIEEAYGIEDGKVNEHFKVASGTAPQSEFRTLEEDQAYNDAWVEANGPAYPDDALDPGLFDLPELPESPQLPVNPFGDSPSLLPIAGAASQVVDQAVVNVNSTLTGLAGLYR